MKGFTTRGLRWERRQSWFLLLFLTYFLYWVPLAYMGLRVLQFRWVIYALFYAGPSLLLLFMLGTTTSGLHFADLRYLWYSTNAFWVFALIHTWAAREEFLMRLAEAQDERDELRQKMRAAREPDGGTVEPVPGAAPQPGRRRLHWNTATDTELAMLPGFDPHRAQQALELRGQLGGFRSFEHFAEQLQLSEKTQARLRPLFAPDPEAKTPEIPQDDPAYRVLPDGSRVIELNWASAETLGALPGLGPDLGRRAVALREGDGVFKSAEDFRFRLGLTIDVMVKIAPYVTVISMSTKAAGGPASSTGGRIVDA